MRLGIFGSSGISGAYMRFLREMPDVSVSHVHSREPDRARAFAAEHGIPNATSNIGDILSSTEIDAVIVATEPARHVDIGLAAIDAQKHVLIEKPAALTMQRADDLRAAAESAATVVSVVSQMRFNEDLAAMRSAFASTVQGPPVSATLRLMWHRGAEYYGHPSGWRRSESDFALNQGIHWLDIMNWFFGTPKGVLSCSRSDRTFNDCVDQTHAIIEYDSGAIVSFTGASVSDTTVPDQFEIFTPSGHFDFADYQIKPEIQPPGIVGRLLGSTPRSSPQAMVPLLKRQLDDFLSAIQDGSPPTTTVENACAALDIALAISRSGLHHK